jgi:hypothetical protein
VKAGRKVASCPVARTERKGNVVFSPDHLDGSTFKLAYISHIKAKDEKWIGMPSGNFMTFPLGEFAKAGSRK